MKRSVMTWSFLLMMFTLSTAVPGFPESSDNPDNGKTHTLEPVAVTADRPAVRKDLDQKSLTNPYRVEESAKPGTEVFTQEDIRDLQPRDVNDLIDKAVGLNVTYQGRKSPYFINERGGGSFTYIIDGAILPPSSNRILYKIPLSAIEELKIVRGATSLTLGPSIGIGASTSGSGLNTGFIIIRTRRPEKTEAELKASVEKATVGLPAANKASVFGGTRLGDPSAFSGYIGGLLAEMTQHSKESWFDGQDYDSGMINTGLKAGKFSMNMMAYTDSGRFEMQRGITAANTLDTSRWYYDPLKTTVYAGDLNMEWSPGQTTLLNLFKTQYRQEEHDGSFTSGTETETNYSEDTKGFGLRHNARFGGTLLQFGGQLSNSTGYGPNTNQSYNRYDTTVYGWSASVEQHMLNERLIVDGGYRQDIKHIENSSNKAANDSFENNVDMAPSRIFAIGTRAGITDIFALSGRYFHGTQGTSGDFDMQAQTGELHPEKQDRIEITGSAEVAPFFRPELTWFSVKDKNQKTASSTTYALNGATYYYYTESDELRRGIELIISGTVLKKTSYKVSWARMLTGETTSSTGVITDAIGVSIPRNIYTLALNHHWNAYTFNLSAKKVDTWTSSTSAMGVATDVHLGDYTRVDANIQRDFAFKNLLLNITLYGRNLTDENYATRYTTGYYEDRGCTLGTEITLKY